MTQPVAWHREDFRLLMFVRNILSRYGIILLGAVLSLIVLPINLQYLGTDAYGLWMLTASITAYFTVLELGYGSATVKYVAEYRARQDATALNEIASTTFFLFTALGLLCYAIALVIAWALPHVFPLDPAQVRTGRLVLLIIAANVALHFVFAVYGGVVNGFERNYKNAIPATVSHVAAAAANVAVLWLGYGLVELVAVTTLIRMVPYWHYRRNAYEVFPGLQIRRAHWRRDRLRELTGFSAYLAIIDWSARLTYTSALLLIGYFLNTTAVALYSIGEKIADAILKVTNQLHTLLFPAIVHRSVQGTVEGQQRLTIRAARFQLAVTVALAASLGAVADVLIPAWVRQPGLEQSVSVMQVLLGLVVLRTWMAMPTTVLKATGHHKFVAMASSSSAVASVLLSIVLVNTVGILGAALGASVPALVLAAAFIFPRACRVLSLPIWSGYRQIVWPTLWPAVPVVALLAATRHAIPVGLPAVLALAALGALLYAALFAVWGLGRDERQWMWSALQSLRRRQAQEPAATPVRI